MNIVVGQDKPTSKRFTISFIAIVAAGALALGAVAAVPGGFKAKVHLPLPAKAEPMVAEPERVAMPIYFLVDSPAEAATLTALSYTETDRRSVVVMNNSAEAQYFLDGAAASWGDYALSLVDMRGW